MAALQFGETLPGRSYRDRPAAFGVLERDGKIALVRVDKPDHAPWLDLPGGAIDPGETPADAVVREYGEEAGLRVRALEPFALASQYFLNTDGEALNNQATFFVLALEADDPGLKVEDDHTLVWAEPASAVAQLRHDAHAWAVAAWMRRLRPGA